MATESPAPAEVVGTQIVTIDPVKYVAAVYAPFRDQFAVAKAAADAVKVIDVTTPAGMKTAVQHRAAMRTIRVEAEKARVFRKKPILDIGKLLDTRYRELESEITPIEDRFDTAIKAEEDRKEAERSAREKAEADRIDRIQSAIRDIRGALIDVAGRDSGVIDDKIRELVGLEIYPDAYAEFLEEAEGERVRTLGRLRELRTSTLAQEQEAVKLAAERAEFERQKAEHEEAERQARERAAADQKRRDDEDAQRREAIDRADAARSEIMGIQQQVIIAQIGRLGVRIGGTILCIRETLDETEAWPITEEKFGPLTTAAQKMKDNAVASIRALLETAEAREAEDTRIKADAKALEDRQRADREAEEERQRQARLTEEQREREERLARETAEREEREQREAQERKDRESAEAHRIELESIERARRKREDDMLDGRAMLQAFVDRFSVYKEFAKLVRAMKAYLKATPAGSTPDRGRTAPADGAPTNQENQLV